MGLLLPILLVGLAQPADQPSTPVVTAPAVQTDSAVEPRRFSFTPAGEPRKFSLTPESAQMWERQVRPFDHIEPDVVTGIGPPVCLTMRSYYFERRDDLAPEYKGMTTCESSRSIAQKRAHRGRARLVPAR